MNTYLFSGEEYDLQLQGFKEDLRFYLSEIKKSKRTLDIACGTGRIMIPALKARANIDGLDNSPSMLKTLQRKAKAAGLKPKTYLADMRNFDLNKKFDLIIIPCRSFLHLLNAKEQKSALLSIHKHLTNKGRLILNFFNPDYNRMANFNGKKEFHSYVKDPVTKNKVKISAINHFYSADQILKITYIHEELDKHNLLVEKKEFKMMMRYIFRFEFEHLLALTGFKPLKLYGDFKRSNFTDKSREMVWVCQKV
ncbi:MAG: class I SAM-dependent methyltransferase [Patescibacteria group bacterium]